MASALAVKDPGGSLSLHGQLTSVYPRSKALSLRDRLKEYRLTHAKSDPYHALSGNQTESPLALHVVRPFAESTFIGNVRLPQSAPPHKGQDPTSVSSVRNKEIHSIRSVILKRQKSAKYYSKFSFDEGMVDGEDTIQQQGGRERVLVSDLGHHSPRQSSPSVDSQSHFLPEAHPDHNSSSRTAIQKLNDKYKAHGPMEPVHLPKPIKPPQVKRNRISRVASRKLGDINRVTAVSRCDAVEIVDNQIATIDGTTGQASSGASEQARRHIALLSRRKNHSRQNLAGDESPRCTPVDMGCAQYAPRDEGSHTGVGLPVLHYNNLSRVRSMRVPATSTPYHSPHFRRNSGQRRGDPWQLNTRNLTEHLSNSRMATTGTAPRVPPQSPTTPPSMDTDFREADLTSQASHVSLTYTTVKSRMASTSMPLVLDVQDIPPPAKTDFTRSTANMINESVERLGLDSAPRIEVEPATIAASEQEQEELESRVNSQSNNDDACEASESWQEQSNGVHDYDQYDDAFYQTSSFHESGTPLIPDLPPDTDSMVPLCEGIEREASYIDPNYRRNSSRGVTNIGEVLTDDPRWNPRGLKSSHILVRDPHVTHHARSEEMDPTQRVPLNTTAVTILEPPNTQRDNGSDHPVSIKPKRSHTSNPEPCLTALNERTPLVDVIIYSGNNTADKTNAKTYKGTDKADLADVSKYPAVMFDPNSYSSYQHAKFRGKKSKARNSKHSDNTTMRFLRVSLGDESDQTNTE